MEALLIKLIVEVPNLAAMIIVVWLFLKSQERIVSNFTETIKIKDAAFTNVLDKIAQKLSTMDLREEKHAADTSSAIGLMMRTVGNGKTRRRTDKLNK